MLIDAFLFLNECDLLELRLSELDGVVDRFILIESPVTFRGDPKPLHYLENIDRFARWRDRITHVVPDDLPTGANPWEREHASRGWIVKALKDVSEHDIVIVSDVDEIPRADAVKRYRPFMGTLDLQMRMYRYHFNYLDIRELWYYPKIGTVGDMRRADDGKSGIRYHQGRDWWRVIPDAGWHFTYMGGRDRVIYKVNQFSHCHDEDARRMVDKIESGQSPVEFDDWKLRKVPVDDTFPAYVREHEKELKEKGMIA